MPSTQPDDVAHLHTSIDEIIRLAYIELPTAAKFGHDALTCDNSIDAADKLERMRTCAAQARCEYLTELIDLALQQLNDITVDWVAFRGEAMRADESSPFWHRLNSRF